MNYSSLAIGLFLVVAALMLFVGAPLQQWNVHVGLIASSFVAILLPALFVLVWLRRDEEHPQPLVRARFGVTPVGVAAIVVTTVVLALTASVATGLLVHAHPALLEMSKVYQHMVFDMLYPGDPTLRALALFAILVAAPLNEEILFRGVMLPMQRHRPRSTAVVLFVNGLLFSLLHMNPLNGLALIAIGAFFAHIALLTQSVWPSVLAHAILNFVNGFAVPELAGDIADADTPAMSLVIASAILIPLTALLWRWCASKLKTSPTAYG